MPDLENREWWVKKLVDGMHLYQFSQPPFHCEKKVVEVHISFSWPFLHALQKQSGHFNPYRVASVAILASENVQLSAVQ